MVEQRGEVDDDCSIEGWFLRAQELVPVAVKKAKEEVNCFSSRWKVIVSKIEQIPSCLSDLSSHPCFSKNALCKEQLQAVSKTLEEAIRLAELCGSKERYEGKLRMQSDLDALSGKLDLNLRDCMILIKTGVLGEFTFPLGMSDEVKQGNDVRELFARLQIGDLEAKNKAIDSLVEAMNEEEKSFMAAIGRSQVASLAQLLTSACTRIREKAVTLVCCLAESGNCENWLLSEGVLPPLIRLIEFGGAIGREKAAICLQRMSISEESARDIVRNGGVRPLIELCHNGDSVSQSVAACSSKNISVVPELRQALAEEGIVKTMINLLDHGIVPGSKEYASECLQSLTSSNENLRRSVISEGGAKSLLAYLDSPTPQESAVTALRNLVGSISELDLISLGLLPRMIHVLNLGSSGAQQAAVSTICRVLISSEMKKLVAEAGFIPLLIKMLEAKSNNVREFAAQAIASLMTVMQNRREVRRNDKSVPNLVQLLDPSPHNTAKKYAISCLCSLSSSRKCKKLMIAYGAIGYLKKLKEMDIPGTKMLLDRLERGKLRSLFSRK